MHAAHLDVEAAGLDPAAGVVRVHPAGRGHARPEFGPGQVGDMPAVLLRRGVPEVAQRVRGNRRVEVVRAEHEHAGPVQQRAERLEQWLNGLLVRDRVPGVHDEIRGQRIQGPEPREQPVSPWGQVDVGQMEHPQRFGARSQNRHLGLAQGEPVPFHDAAVAERRTAGRGGQREGAQWVLASTYGAMCRDTPRPECPGQRLFDQARQPARADGGPARQPAGAAGSPARPPARACRESGGGAVGQDEVHGCNEGSAPQ